MLQQFAEKENAEESALAGIKIVQLISRLCVGGTTLEVILAAEGLQQRGYQVLLLTGETSDDEGSWYEMAAARGIGLVKVPSLARDISWKNDLAALYELVRLFRHERPSIVHTHTAKAGLLGRIAARLAGVPISIHTFHGHVFRGHFSALKARAFLLLERLTARWTDALVAVSESQSRELVEEFHVGRPDQFVTIRVGLELDPFLRLNGPTGALRPSGEHEQAPLIGWVGRLSQVKEPTLFIGAAARLRQSFSPVEFVMAGDGELRAEVESLAVETGVSQSIRFLGWYTDLFNFYSDVAFVMLTSRHEGTPLVLLEAMASGRTFVSTDVGGIHDLMVGDGRRMPGFEVFENGILADSTPAALAAASQYLLENPGQANIMGQVGRIFVAKTFSHRRMTDDLEDLYLRLLQVKGISAAKAESSR